MADVSHGNLGVFGSLRRLGHTFLAILENRIELAALEWRDEQNRATAILIGAAVMIFCGFMTAIVLTVLAVVVFWEQAAWVLAGFSIFYPACGLAAWLWVRKKCQEPLFPETRAQLQKDRQWIFPQN